jgi:hypothetical protein
LSKKFEESRLEFFIGLFGTKNGIISADYFLKSSKNTFTSAFLVFLLSLITVSSFFRRVLLLLSSNVLSIPRYRSDIFHLKIQFGAKYEDIFVSIYCLIFLFFIFSAIYLIYSVIRFILSNKISLKFASLSDKKFLSYLLKLVLSNLLLLFFYFYDFDPQSNTENLSFLQPLYLTGLILPFQYLSSSFLSIIIQIDFFLGTSFLFGFVVQFFGQHGGGDGK